MNKKQALKTLFNFHTHKKGTLGFAINKAVEKMAGMTKNNQPNQILFPHKSGVISQVSANPGLNTKEFLKTSAKIAAAVKRRNITGNIK